MMNEPITQQEQDYLDKQQVRVNTLQRLKAGLSTTPTPLADKYAIKVLETMLHVNTVH